MKISQGLGTKFKQIIIDIDAQKASISIYKVDDVPSGSNTGDAYVVSGDDIWLPGVFDSRVAALLFASMLTPDQQEQIWADESHNPGRQIGSEACLFIHRRGHRRTRARRRG